MFDSLARSRFGSKPFALYRFALGPLVYGYTSADRDGSHAGEAYASVDGGIEHTALSDSADGGSKDIVKVTVPHLLDPAAAEYPVTQPLGQHFRPYGNRGSMQLVIMAAHRGDADVHVEWTGRVVSASFTDTQMTLACHPSSRSGDRGGVRIPWQRSCGLVVYGQGRGQCNLRREDFAVPAVLADAAGMVLTAPEFAAAPFTLAGGYIEWVMPSGLVQQRGILEHTGDAIRMHFWDTAFAPGLSVTAYPHCEQTYAACAARGNTENFGGAKEMPVKDPMKGLGSPVWN